MAEKRRRRSHARILLVRDWWQQESMTGNADVTALLLAWNQGDEAARSRLIEVVYNELRRVARNHLRRERGDHTLTPTALVHETYVKLVDLHRVRWQNRAHFFAMSARLMRRILVDHARSRAADKRGAGQTVALDTAEVGITPVSIDVLALDTALEKLAAVDERQGRLVELRFFAGLTVEETAAVLDVAPITIKRDWAYARAWLFRELQALKP
jgi:RNA polymerase sigma factor (TIGR02999 family)